MGITCKPIGTLQKLFAKMDREKQKTLRSKASSKAAGDNKKKK